MLRSIYFHDDGSLAHDLSYDQIHSALTSKRGWLWLSMEALGDEDMIAVLGGLFHFHQLTIEDCLSQGYQAAKIDEFDDYLFITAHAVVSDPKTEELETIELNMYISEHFLVTSSRRPIPAIERVWHLLERDNRLQNNGSDFLCHALLDHVVDDYMPLIDAMDEEIEILEDRVLAKPSTETLDRILRMKHTVMTLRRIIGPMREMMNRLSRDEFPMIDRKSQIYFRDIYDHLVRIQDLSESIRDIVSSSMDIYLNSNSLRMNEIMKALTIVSTIFLPLSFVAGIYGMNFEYMPELYWRWGYPMVWGIFILVTGGMLYYFKRKDWF